MENTVEVQIWGQKYTIKSDTDEDHIRNVASFVDKKMKEIAEKTSTLSTMNIAILAALNIADELFEIKKKGPIKINKGIERRVSELNKLLDSYLR